MSKVLVIPDVHLKPWIFDRAEKILESGQADFAVQLGDLVDDWDCQTAVALYKSTILRAIKFNREFPNTLWCMGNHDYGYYYPRYGRRETGHSKDMEDEMSSYLKRMRRARIQQKLVHAVDNVLFSHAGLTGDWVGEKLLDASPMSGIAMTQREFWSKFWETVVNNITDSNALWESNSPLWARLLDNPSVDALYGTVLLQVVGHTPVKKITGTRGFLFTDVFSTYSNGSPLGERRFAIVNTVTREWWYAEEDV